MANQPTFTLSQNQPLIGIPFEEKGKEVTAYFSKEEVARKAKKKDAVKKARALAGAWADLDWKEMLDALDRIRHESKPTPPIDEI